MTRDSATRAGWKAKRREICRECPGVFTYGDICPYARCETCRNRNWTARPGACCPDDPPRWLPVDPHEGEALPTLDEVRTLLESEAREREAARHTPNGGPRSIAWIVTAQNERGLTLEVMHPARADIIAKSAEFRASRPAPEEGKPPQRAVFAAQVAEREDLIARWGGEVRRTVRSLADSVVRGSSLRIVVVDDASTDGSCDDVPEDVIRHELPSGTARSQNEALARVLARGAEVVGFSDGHMRFDPEVLEILADKALEGPAVVMGISKGTDSMLRAGEGCELAQTPALGVAAKWTTPEWEGRWGRVTAPMGACVAMSTETIRILSGPTGRLWDNVAGLWGYQEELLALKCALLGIPLYVSRHWGAFHDYRPVNPLATAVLDRNLNVAYGLPLIFHEEVYREHFIANCHALVGPPKATELFERAEQDIERPWSAADERRLLDSLPERED